MLRHVWRSNTGATQVSGIASYATAFGSADPLPPSATYRNLPTLPFDTVKANDEAAKPKVMQRQRDLLNQRYDLAAVILDPYSGGHHRYGACQE